MSYLQEITTKINIIKKKYAALISRNHELENKLTQSQNTINHQRKELAALRDKIELLERPSKELDVLLAAFDLMEDPISECADIYTDAHTESIVPGVPENYSGNIFIGDRERLADITTGNDGFCIGYMRKDKRNDEQNMNTYIGADYGSKITTGGPSAKLGSVPRKYPEYATGEVKESKQIPAPKLGVPAGVSVLAGYALCGGSASDEETQVYV